jgi:outer membrane protein OmpA-like peptidoglycan-associated protein
MRWLPWLVLLAALLLLWYLFAHRHAATPVASTEATAPAAATAPVVAEAPVAATTEAPAATAPAATDGLPANVYFDVGSSKISGDGAKAIAAAADAVKKDSARVAITGYTDKTGDTAKNQELAKNRAKAVRAALQAAGVPEASIEMRPPLSVETGANASGDAEARRVEISKI